MSVIIAFASMVVAGFLAVLRYREYKRDKDLALRAGKQDEVKAPAERDSIIVGGATQAVQLLREALDTAAADIAKVRRERDEMVARLAQAELLLADYKAANADLSARIGFLEKEVARLMNSERTGEGTG